MNGQTWVVEVSLPGSGPTVGYLVIANNQAEAIDGVRAMISLVGYKVIKAYHYGSDEE